jgi:hypothetical protein
MTELKACRHCGEPILPVARVCRHCHSNQGWFSNQRDPRFHLLIALLLLPLLVVPFMLMRDARAKFNRVVSPDASCRGLVSVKSSSYDTRSIDGRDRLFVRAEVVNTSSTDVSDPAIRVLMIGPEGEVEDTFIRTVYDANIAPQRAYWLRVDGEMTVEPIRVKEIRAEIASADCKPAWK